MPGGKTEIVCIERNADVYVEDLLPAIEDAFKLNGIATRVLDVPLLPVHAASRMLLRDGGT